jgi:glucan 1,3-beta-glucosidase
MKLFLPTLVASVVLMLSGGADALNVKMPGVNYNSRKGPDWAPDSSKCKSASEVQKDMYALKGITDKVRIYSLVDCNQAELVLPAAKNAGLQVHLGIWTTNSHDYLLQEKAKLAGLIDSGLYDDNVIGLHVGSETVYRKEISADTAISYMKEIRDYIRGRGKNTPVTIADVIDIYYANQQLIDAVDYISVNQFSFWERADVNEGTAVTLDRLRNLRIAAAKKGKKVVISEVGWSSGGSDPSAGVASPENQAKFFSDFFQMARAHNFDYYWYVAFDSKWRVTNGGKEVEADFGVFQEDDTMKSNFQQLTIGWKDPRALRNAGTKLVLSEKASNLYMSAKSTNWLVKDQQVWFFDSATKQVRSKSSDRCLDAYQGWNGGIVHVYRCMDNEANQKWTFESSTGKLKHVKHQGFCLDQDAGQGNKLQLYGCSPNNPNQQWSVINPANI